MSYQLLAEYCATAYVLFEKKKKKEFTTTYLIIIMYGILLKLAVSDMGSAAGEIKALY